jgi:predicted RNA-binding protein with PIN domain
VDCGPDAVARSGRVGRPRRSPLPVPRGLFADDPEVGEHFVRVPGVQLVVDGYNVAKAGWPELSLAAQRARLIDALDELGARTGCVSYVVFDGVGEQDRTASRRAVRVRFTERGVLADDEVVRLAEGIPADRPVVVVSSDRVVRDGARSAGCALLGAAQLLGVLGR